MAIDFRAPADASATDLDTHSIDVVYSFLVLSFIRASDLRPIARACRRVLRVGGRSVHRIRLSDPYSPVNGGDELRFLSFSDPLWNPLCNNSIQRNNRLRAGDFIELLAPDGDRVEWDERELKYKSLQQVRTMSLDRRFRGQTPEDLASTVISLVVRRL